MHELKCLRCGTMMDFLGIRELPFDNIDFIEVDRDKVVYATLKFELYECPECGKAELYKPKHIVYKNKELEEVKVEKAKWSALRR